MTLPERIAQSRLLCENALASAPLDRAVQFLAQADFSWQTCRDLLRTGGRNHKAAPELIRLRSDSHSAGLSSEEFVFERALLVRVALSALDEIPQLPVDESVQHLFCREFAFYAGPPKAALPRFALESPQFAAMSGLVSLTRFPAGQHQWVVSGFPRSWLVKIPLRRIPGICYFLGKKLRGFSPYFVPHVNATSSSSSFLTERELLKTFYRMAAALEKQPSIRGIMAGSWMHSRETHRVSPHLAFFNRPYMEAGGIYVDRGPARPAEGFLIGDPSRASRYEGGEYKPTFGMVFCTRDQAIAWKHAHPELEPLLAVRS